MKHKLNTQFILSINTDIQFKVGAEVRRESLMLMTDLSLGTTLSETIPRVNNAHFDVMPMELYERQVWWRSRLFNVIDSHLNQVDFCYIWRNYKCTKIDCWSFLVILLTTNLNELSIMCSISPCRIEPSRITVFHKRLFMSVNIPIIKIIRFRERLVFDGFYSL